MFTLYEYNHALDELVDPDTGEILDYEAFISLSMEREQKIENVAVMIKNLNAEADLIKAEEAALKARREPMERRSARLKDYLVQFLNGEKFDCPRASLRFRKSTALNVSDVKSAAEWLEGHGHFDMVVRDAPKLDKRAVSMLVKSGEDVPGVALEERYSLQVR